MSKTVMRIDARVRTRVPLSVDLECLYNDVLTTIYYKRFKRKHDEKNPQVCDACAGNCNNDWRAYFDKL